jgi:hypothetical protein
MGRDARVASNEGLLREVNDRIEEVMERFGNGEARPEDEETDFLCECGTEDCVESVRMSIREYEDVRRDEDHFVVSGDTKTPTSRTWSRQAAATRSSASILPKRQSLKRRTLTATKP